MIEVEGSEIALEDEQAIRELVERLEVPHEDFTGWQAPPAKLVDRYFPYQPKFHWHRKEAHWFAVKARTEQLQIVTVRGFKSEREARLLRQRWVRSKEGAAPSLDAVRALAEQIEHERPERTKAETFAAALRAVRRYFDDCGNETEHGDLLPVSELGLPPEDVELLRMVAERLPEALVQENRKPPLIRLREPPCPLCSASPDDLKEPEKLTPANDRKQAVKQLQNDGFRDWYNVRLTMHHAPGVWTRPGELYDDYVEWTQTGHDHQSFVDRVEARAAVISKTAWGRQMSKVVQKRRDGRNNLYNVRLKKR